MFTGKEYGEYVEYLDQIEESNSKIYEMRKKIKKSQSLSCLINDTELSAEEFINIIALRNLPDYDKTGSGAGIHDDQQTDQGYANTPLKFIEEFLQNADDCEYDSVPKIEMVLDEDKSVIEFIYNEKGFSREDVLALTSRGKSPKLEILRKGYPDEGVFYRRKTGKKGTGFKSVFTIDAKNIIVHITSNGFSFRLDKSIGRTIPIYENEVAIEGKTHIVVEIINPTDTFLGIYQRIRNIFCINQTKDFFKTNPLLFMRKIKELHVHKRGGGAKKSFSITFGNPIKSVFSEVIVPDGEVEAGIRHDSHFFGNVLEYFNVKIEENQKELAIIPIYKYTKMIKINNIFTNASIITPVMTQESGRWQTGSLFTTFPLIEHTFDLPFAIDAPFELNLERKAIDYKNKGYNQQILDLLFIENGVLAEMLLKIRSVKDIHMDYYFARNSVKLFDEDIDANRDSDRNKYIETINITKLLKVIPVFVVYGSEGEFISYKGAFSLDEEMFGWPFIGNVAKIEGKKLISERYAGNSIFSAETFSERFACVINAYLDELEKKYPVSSKEFLSFCNEQLYPYLIKRQYQNETALSEFNIYIWKTKNDTSVKYVREGYSSKLIYIMAEGDQCDESFGRYRVIESSAVRQDLLETLCKSILRPRKISIEFSDGTINKTARSYTEWGDVCQFIKTAKHFGGNLNILEFSGCKKYALPSSMDVEFNPYREAGILEEVSEESVKDLQCYLGYELDDMILLLKKMCLKMPDSFFVRDNRYDRLSLTAETKALLNAARGVTLSKTLDLISDELKLNDRKLDVQFDDLIGCNPRVYRYFIRQKKYFRPDDYENLCDDCQKCEDFWKNDVVSQEILLRAIRGARHDIQLQKQKAICLRMEDIFKYHWGGLVFYAFETKKYTFISIVNDGYFEILDDSEKISTVRYLAPEKVAKIEKLQFYLGDFGDSNFKHKYLTDGDSVYLQNNAEGDYIEALKEYLSTDFDKQTLAVIQEMRNQYRQEYMDIIRPSIQQFGDNMQRAYQDIERTFEYPERTKKQIISILSWFRDNGNASAFGNGNIDSQEKIKKSYANEPWRFVYEFIQNVDDCRFSNDHPELNIYIDKAMNRVVFEYNEDGFTLDDIKAITKFGGSDKSKRFDELYVAEGIFNLRLTGQKGIGFKSVFALPGDDIVVHVQSNGYSFKFVKKLGVIVPIWEDVEKPIISGTQIIVEGFESNSISAFYKKLLKLLGASAKEEFFAECPTLFLRKLKKVSITDGKDTYAVDIVHSNLEVAEPLPIDVSTVTCGIICDGKLYTKATERLTIKVPNYENPIEAIQVSEVIKEARDYYVISAVAPVIKKGKDVSFTKGALFSTLPLSRNKLSIPVAINAAFVLNDDRSVVVDDKLTENLNECVFNNLLESLYIKLREQENIAIDEYVPNEDTVIFDDESYQFVKARNIYDIARKMPILKLYSQVGFISPEKAVILPKDCYKWNCCDKLAAIFGGLSEDLLVEDQYVDSRIKIKLITLVNKRFVQHMNEYLDALSFDDVAYVLEKYIYNYILINQKNLRNVLGENHSQLADIRMFVFQTATGEVIRENVSDSSVYWVKDCDKFSCGSIRSLKTAAVSVSEELYKWVEEYHDLWEIEKLVRCLYDKKFDFINCWEDASDWLTSLIYYGYEESGSIRFFNQCSLCEGLDTETNIFRDAFEETGNSNILKYIITEDDILNLAIKLELMSIESKRTDISYIIEVVKKSGLRRADNFLQIHKETNNACCTPATLELLKEYSSEKEKIEDILCRVKDHYLRMKSSNKRTVEDLVITYKEIESCGTTVTNIILKNKLLSGPTLLRLAKDCFYQKCAYCANVDDKEILIRCLDLITEEDVENNIYIEIELRDIIARQLGSQLQSAQLKHLRTLEMAIGTLGMELQPYPKESINKAIEWMGDRSEEATSINDSYEYYLYDIKAAFGGGDCFIFDSEKVILDNHVPENEMLSFIHRRFKGEAEKYKSILEIIKEQNELQNWKRNNNDKKLYIERLCEYRKKTNSVLDILCPNVEEIYQSTTEDAIAYVIPELLQNINDCKKSDENKSRILNIEIDIEKGVMILSYRERGFDFDNVYSITSIGKSTKNDDTEGEKGLGFKKVFSVFDLVEIYSNGFFFRLRHKEKTMENTIPHWIDDAVKQKRYAQDGITTMVMSITSGRTAVLKKLLEQWERIFKGNYEEGTFSPLFLRNIDGYVLNGRDEILRSKIMEGYRHFEFNILSTYEKLLALNMNQETVRNKIEEVYQLLSARKKKRGMSDEEYRNYIGKLSFSLCIPKRTENIKSGRFYSTLATEIEAGIAINLNLPLELTTGRDAIDKTSAYNKQLVRLVFDTPNTQESIFGYILQKMAEEQPDLELLNYLHPGLERFVSWLEQYSEGITERFKEELCDLKIFKAAEGEELVSLSEGYCMLPVVNRYITLEQSGTAKLIAWLEKNTSAGKEYIMFKVSSKEKYTKLFEVAKFSETPKGYFPLNEEGMDVTLAYFMNEYGTR